MLKKNKIIANGLKKWDQVVRSHFTKHKTTLRSKRGHKKTIQKKMNHDDLQDHDDIESEFDEILLPESDDLFDKDEVQLIITSNVPLINAFPNALLINHTGTIQKEIPIKKDTIEIKKEDNIWNIIEKMKTNDHSESFDTLTTESETMTDESNEENKSNMICKGCGTKGSLIEDQHTSVIVCSECGFVNEELLDHGPEWRQYNNEDSRSEGVGRCGCPSSFFFPKSSQGTIITGINNIRLKRKQKWNSMVYKERSLNGVFEFIKMVCTKNNITKNIIDTANFLYKKLSDCKYKSGKNIGKQIIIRGENRISIIAACVFKACEMNKTPRSVKEMATFFSLDEKKITKGIKQFDIIMKNSEDNIISMEHFNTDTAEDFIRRHCTKLKISKEDTNIAVRIAQNCSKMKLASDHNPQSVAAGAILVMVHYCQLDIDKKEIAKLFGTSDVTIGKIYNKIAPYATALVDDEATEYLIHKFKING